MLAFIFVSLFIIITALGIGSFSRQYLLSVMMNEREVADNPVELFFMGICIWGALLNIWSLIGAANIYTAIVSLVLVILYIALNANYFLSKTLFPFYKTLWGDNNGWVAGLLLLLLLICAIIPPNNYDAGLYHIQAIKWAEQYAVVPGLGNLHGRFAFNPSIFMLNAATSFRTIFDTGIYAINGVFLGVFLLWLLAQVYQTKNIIKALFYAILIFLCLSDYAMQISSPTPDIAATVLICFVLLRTWQRQIDLETSNIAPFWGDYLPVIIIACYTITIKLNAAPLLLLIAYIAWLCRKTIWWRSVFIFFIIGCFITIPWLVRNVILSGYLVYPISIDLFSPDWKIPMENVIDERNWIYSWARIPAQHWREVLAMPISQWLPIWFDSQKIQHKAVALLLVVLLPFSLLMIWIFKTQKMGQLPIAPLVQKLADNWFIVWAIAYSGCIYWFIMAPSFRFCSAFIWLGSTMPLLLFQNIRFPRWLQRTCRYVILVFFLATVGYFYRNAAKQLLGYFVWGTGQERATAYAPSDYLWKPLPIEVYSWKGEFAYQTYHIDSAIILVPQNENRCFDAGLPCTPLLNPTLTMRGNSLANGFRVLAPNPMKLSDF